MADVYEASPQHVATKHVANELILTFHGLGEPPESIPEHERIFWVPRDWFEAIIAAAPDEGVGITFDDGNVSDVEQALPALLARGMTARFFPLAGRIGAEGYLSAADISELSAAGMHIGSHGLHHCDWRTLEDGELRQELTVSRQTLAGILDKEIAEAACPFGSYNRRVLKTLRAAGYRRVFNSDGDTRPMGSWLLPRTTVDREQPLQYWENLASAGIEAGFRSSPVLLGKRLVRRLR
jgi:peptidoglycan/xylan/chitin deacetylase (PgdA/CDA1 family)